MSFVCVTVKILLLGGLQYEKEYNLNTKPLAINLLIIKK